MKNTPTPTLNCCITFSSHSCSMLSFQLSHSLAFDSTSYNTILLSSGLHVCQCTHSAQSEYYHVEQMLLRPCTSYAEYHLLTHSNRRNFIHNYMVSNQSSLSSQEEDHLPSPSTCWREHGSVRQYPDRSEI